MDGTELASYMGETFRLLIGEPLTAEQLLALSPDQQAMYLIVKIKSSNQPVLTGTNVNHITVPLSSAIQMICASLSDDQVATTSSMLLREHGWMRVVDGRTFTRKSDNITTLLRRRSTRVWAHLLRRRRNHCPLPRGRRGGFRLGA